MQVGAFVDQFGKLRCFCRDEAIYFYKASALLPCLKVCFWTNSISAGYRLKWKSNCRCIT